MSKYQTALVIGKFYPPHNGHKYLIDTALKESEYLYIIIASKPNEIPKADLRLKLIKEWYPNNYNIHFQLVDDIYDPTDSKLWADICAQLLGFVPSVVFTSESYGEPFSKFLGCVHRLVDIDRNSILISGTEIRANPIKYQSYLQNNVRSFYIPRIILVGAESTGKSTLAMRLKEKYLMPIIPEYGRIVAENKTEPMDQWTWTTNEFIDIAKNQINHELDEINKNLNLKFLICDTDSFGASIWCERYCGKIPDEIKTIYNEYDQTVNRQIYLLTKVDVPFVQDGFRDGEHLREHMYERFLDQLKLCNKEFYILEGDYDKKFDISCNIIDSIII